MSTALIAALFVVASAPAPGGVVRFPTRAPERVPTTVVAEIDAAIDAALGKAGQTVTPVDQSCADDACYAAAVGEAGATGGVAVALEATGSDYTISVTVLDAGGKAVATKQSACEICTHPELVTSTGALVTEAATALPAVEEPKEEAAPTRLSVVSSPSGATVFVDGVQVGVTPWSGEVEPGSRRIRVEAKGREPVERVVEATEGKQVDEAFELPSKGRIAPKTEITIGWVALGVGLVAVAAGAALIAIDENEIKSDCDGANVDANGVCKYRHNTLAGGVTFLVLGLAATGTGVGLLVHGYKRRGPNREVALGPGSVRVRF